MAGKEQWEYVGHGAGLGEEDDKHFDSMAERCPFNFSIFQLHNNYFHKGAFLEYSPQPWSVACDTLDAASRDSFAPVIMSLLIYVLEDHFHFLTLLV